MRSRLFCHLVWTTWERRPLLDARAASFLERYLRAVARQERARVLAVGIVTTHVHVLIEVHPTMSMPRLVQRFKGGSSILSNREWHVVGAHTVRWAKDCAVHSVSTRALGAARAYVRSQGDRHPSECIVCDPAEEIRLNVVVPETRQAGIPGPSLAK